MSRFVAFAVVSFGVGFPLIAGTAVGCSDDSLFLTATPVEDAARIDGAPVAPPTEAGDLVDSGPTVTPNCEKYCDLVMSNCTGPNVQYGSVEDCLAFCAHLPKESPTRQPEVKAAGTVACRQYWADSPARTDPASYCLAAGPFGGNVCGDRCTAFCDVVMAACSPDSGYGAYESPPECASACATFSYRDAGAEGGGEDPRGPGTGDTLNCRLYYLRGAVTNPNKCVLLRPGSGTCDE